MVSFRYTCRLVNDLEFDSLVFVLKNRNNKEEKLRQNTKRSSILAVLETILSGLCSVTTRSSAWVIVILTLTLSNSGKIPDTLVQVYDMTEPDFTINLPSISSDVQLKHASF